MTLVELLIGTLIALMIGGAIMLVFGQGFVLSERTSSYSRALRGAESSFEFLPGGIAFASEVETLPAAHGITDVALRDERWRYIVRQGAQLHEIYWDKGARIDTPVPGSEYLIDAQFGPVRISGDISPDAAGGDILGVTLKAVGHRNMPDTLVEMERSMIVRAPNGVSGDWGPILRYKSMSRTPVVEVYSGDISPPLPDFGDVPASWKSVKYSFSLGFEGRLEIENAPQEDKVLFKWIHIAPGLLEDIEYRALTEKPDSYKLKAFLENKLFAFDVVNARAGDTAMRGEIRVDYVDENVLREGETFKGRYAVSDVPGDILGKYLILAAVYTPSGSNVRDYMPVYVKIGDINSDSLFKDIVSAFSDLHEGGNGDGDVKINNQKAGVETYLVDENGRGYVTFASDAKQATGGSDAPQKFQLTLDDSYFSHMDTSKYGATNYSIYIDTTLDRGLGGGFGVLLNGDSSIARNPVSGNYETSGYVFQVDPGLAGYVLRYMENNIQQGNSDLGLIGEPGARVMYVYDSVKKTAPKDIVSLAGSENFSENAGRSAFENILYRLPATSPRAKADTFMQDKAEKFDKTRALAFSAPGYGTVQTDFGCSIYSPKHLQTWDKADPDKGFRWDGLWAIRKDPQAQRNWTQRTITKLTILEVTRDILPSELEAGWAEQSDGGHKAGDLIVRAEEIKLKPGATNWADSRNYVYSKPMWFGKFKGDTWTLDSASVFKKMSNGMMHEIAAPEPREGDDQSFRRRGMRIRSWLESVTASHPDYKMGNDKVWTPPIAVDLNNGDTIQDNEFGMYTYKAEDYQNPLMPGLIKNGTIYTGEISPKTPGLYGRLGMKQSSTVDRPPVMGLYAVRGWDYGQNEYEISPQNKSDKDNAAISPTERRFLSVYQGTQLPYRRTNKNKVVYDKKRERTFGMRLWGLAQYGAGESGFTLHDTWIGEGFAPEEVRELLGLKQSIYQDDTKVESVYSAK